MHRGEWRFVSLPDLSLLLKAVLCRRIAGCNCGVSGRASGTGAAFRVRAVRHFTEYFHGRIAHGISNVQGPAFREQAKREEDQSSLVRVLPGSNWRATLIAIFRKRYNIVAFVDDDEDPSLAGMYAGCRSRTPSTILG